MCSACIPGGRFMTLMAILTPAPEGVIVAVPTFSPLPLMKSACAFLGAAGCEKATAETSSTAMTTKCRRCIARYPLCYLNTTFTCKSVQANCDYNFTNERPKNGRVGTLQICAVTGA